MMMVRSAGQNDAKVPLLKRCKQEFQFNQLAVNKLACMTIYH